MPDNTGYFVVCPLIIWPHLCPAGRTAQHLKYDFIVILSWLREYRLPDLRLAHGAFSQVGQLDRAVHVQLWDIVISHQYMR